LGVLDEIDDGGRALAHQLEHTVALDHVSRLLLVHRCPCSITQPGTLPRPPAPARSTPGVHGPREPERTPGQPTPRQPVSIRRHGPKFNGLSRTVLRGLDGIVPTGRPVSVSITRIQGELARADELLAERRLGKEASGVFYPGQVAVQVDVIGRDVQPLA